MKQLILLICATLILSGCSTLQDFWSDNKRDIVDGIIKQIEKEKVEDRVLDRLIEQLEEYKERRADIAPINSDT